MKLNTEQYSIEWDKAWNNLKTEWVRIEALQDYSGEDESESLSAWIAGDRTKSIELLNTNEEWIKSFQKKGKAGIKLTRIHIVEYPLSKYLEWEIESYKKISIPICGEQVFLVNKEVVKDLNPVDLTFFDDSDILFNRYDKFGKFIGGDILKDKVEIDILLTMKDQLLKKAKLLKLN